MREEQGREKEERQTRVQIIRFKLYEDCNFDGVFCFLSTLGHAVKGISFEEMAPLSVKCLRLILIRSSSGAKNVSVLRCNGSFNIVGILELTSNLGIRQNKVGCGN